MEPYILVQISLKFVPEGSIDNKSVLVQVMTWRRTGDKPLSEPIPIQFTDANMRQHMVKMIMYIYIYI